MLAVHQEETILEFCNELSPPQLCASDTAAAAAILLIRKGFLWMLAARQQGQAHIRCSCCGSPNSYLF